MIRLFTEIAPIAICITLLYALWQADEYCTQLEYDLNVSNTAIMIYKEENKRLAERNEDLEVANECLIKYSNRDRCITAIKHTPLPKLVHEKH